MYSEQIQAAPRTGLIDTIQRRVHAGCVHLFGNVYALPAELHANLEGREVCMDYHVHLVDGVRVYTPDSTADCWAPRVGGSLLPGSRLPKPAVRQVREPQIAQARSGLGSDGERM
jgi:hypothetical protein